MKKLLSVFVALTLLAVLSALAGILLSGDGLLPGRLVVTWKVDAPIVDHSPLPAIPLLGYPAVDSLSTIYRKLARARGDDRVAGIAIDIRRTAFGLATAQELRELLFSLRDAGKFVQCYLDTAGEGTNGTLAYYLATACEQIRLAPAGDLNLLGLFSDSLFVRGTLEKLRIEPNFEQVGSYKSATEQYTEYRHSPAAREDLSAALDSLFDQIVGAISAARGMTDDQVRALVDRAPFVARDALASGLLDGLAYPDEFEDLISSLSGDARVVSLADYGNRRHWARGRRVAVVFAQGTIRRGESGFNPWTDELFLGSDELIALLDSLGEEESVVAVILRIDSPGGSAMASDLISRAVERLAAAKPVIVSMSDIAASGGYYIAAKANGIVAGPASVTGSIGVWGGKLVTRRFQEELLGVTHDTLQRGANADLYSSILPFSEEQAASYRRLMEEVYQRFLRHVADGRNLDLAAVRAVAEGRIWTGSAALERGLVDALGGLDRAVSVAADTAGLEAGSFTLDYYPRPPGLLDLLLRPRAIPSLVTDLGPLRSPSLLRLPPELAGLARPF